MQELVGGVSLRPTLGTSSQGRQQGLCFPLHYPKFYSLEKGYLLLCYTPKTFSDMVSCIFQHGLELTR